MDIYTKKEIDELAKILEENGKAVEVKNAVALEFIVYYVANGKGILPEFVRLFKTDTGYEFRHCAKDDVLATLGEDDITFGYQCADWNGIHLSANPKDLLPFIAMLHDAYKEEPEEETE